LLLVAYVLRTAVSPGVFVHSSLEIGLCGDSCLLLPDLAWMPSGAHSSAFSILSLWLDVPWDTISVHNAVGAGGALPCAGVGMPGIDARPRCICRTSVVALRISRPYSWPRTCGMKCDALGLPPLFAFHLTLGPGMLAT
jgi:hypothetical protein